MVVLSHFDQATKVEDFIHTGSGARGSLTIFSQDDIVERIFIPDNRGYIFLKLLSHPIMSQGHQGDCVNIFVTSKYEDQYEFHKTGKFDFDESEEGEYEPDSWEARKDFKEKMRIINRLVSLLKINKVAVCNFTGFQQEEAAFKCKPIKGYFLLKSEESYSWPNERDTPLLEPEFTMEIPYFQ